MRISDNQIEEYNVTKIDDHQASFEFIADRLTKKGVDVREVLEQIKSFQVAIPSWALGAGGTRFGRFSIVGEPRNLEEKIEDVGMLHALNKSSEAISLHIPWDIPEDPARIKKLAEAFNIKFDAVNSNTFQDQSNQELSYKYGSLAHMDKNVRQQAVEHNMAVIDHGVELGSKSLTVWLADGSCFPGQADFKRAFKNTLESLQKIYKHLPEDWQMFIEYKPFEPNFYHTVIQDWGTSYLLASELGNKASCLVDLGHHLPNTNIEQIVATLSMVDKLGGFHFNDSKYGDDDLTVGSIKPYQLYLIFIELVKHMQSPEASSIAYMIDASHNVKDPLEDLMQSVDAIKVALAQSLILDKGALTDAQKNHDPVRAEELLHDAFRTDVRPLVAEAQHQLGGALNPIELYRKLEVRKVLFEERGAEVASGL